MDRGHVPSIYLQGRQIGDEYRYILERKFADKFVGNMLTRPELLLNPWEVSGTTTGEEELDSEELFANEAPSSRASRTRRKQSLSRRDQSTDFANLDFLPEATWSRLNLSPNASGQLEVDISQLGDETILYVVAVDQSTTDERVVALPPADEQHEPLDLRLTEPLPLEQHFALRQQITHLGPNEAIEIGNLGSGRFQVYDNLQSVFDLYQTLLPESELANFRFVTEWNGLDEETKHAKYSQFACHELNFFLAQKDPEFFEAVIAPYLANKLHKTFMDEYLLGLDLTHYVSHWRFAQLNTVERILLGKRLEEQRVSVLAHLEEQWQQVGTNPSWLDDLFRVGLLANDLRSDASGLESTDFGVPFDERANLQERFEDRARAAAPMSAFESDGAVGGGGTEDAPADADYMVPQLQGLADDLSLRQQMRGRTAFFQPLDQTKEWAENNYYHIPIDQQLPSLVQVNDFWLEWMRSDDRQPFRSIAFAQASRSFTEAMLHWRSWTFLARRQITTFPLPTKRFACKPQVR